MSATARVILTAVDNTKGAIASATAGFRKMGAAISGALGGLGGLIGIGALTAGAKAAFNYGASLGEAAQQMGVTIEQYQLLERAGLASNVSIEKLSTAFNRLAKTQDDAIQGNDKARDAFARLGISMKEVETLSSADMFARISRGLNETGDKAALFDIFGKSALTLTTILNEMGGSVENLRGKFGEGLVTDEDSKRLDEYADKWELMIVRIKAGVASAIPNIIDFFKKVGAGIKSWGYGGTFGQGFEFGEGLRPGESLSPIPIDEDWLKSQQEAQEKSKQAANDLRKETLNKKETEDDYKASLSAEKTLLQQQLGIIEKQIEALKKKQAVNKQEASDAFLRITNPRAAAALDRKEQKDQRNRDREAAKVQKLLDSARGKDGMGLDIALTKAEKAALNWEQAAVAEIQAIADRQEAEKKKAELQAELTLLEKEGWEAIKQMRDYERDLLAIK